MRPATGASGSRSPRPPPLAGGERPAPGPERNRRAGVVAVVAEQPPEPVGPARALVVGDDERAGADAGGGGPRGERFRGRERVTPAALAPRPAALREAGPPPSSAAWAAVNAAAAWEIVSGRAARAPRVETRPSGTIAIGTTGSVSAIFATRPPEVRQGGGAGGGGGGGGGGLGGRAAA